MCKKTFSILFVLFFSIFSYAANPDGATYQKIMKEINFGQQKVSALGNSYRAQVPALSAAVKEMKEAYNFYQAELKSNKPTQANAALARAQNAQKKYELIQKSWGNYESYRNDYQKRMNTYLTSEMCTVSTPSNLCSQIERMMGLSEQPSFYDTKEKHDQIVTKDVRLLARKVRIRQSARVAGGGNRKEGRIVGLVAPRSSEPGNETGTGSCRWRGSPKIYFSPSCASSRFCMGSVSCGNSVVKRVICPFKAGAYTCPQSADECKSQSDAGAVKFISAVKSQSVGN